MILLELSLNLAQVHLDSGVLTIHGILSNLDVLLDGLLLLRRLLVEILLEIKVRLVVRLIRHSLILRLFQ